MHTEKSPHSRPKETHGMRSDIDDNTPLSDVKAPNVFERAKEEIEALVQTIHHKKDSHTHEKRLDIHTQSQNIFLGRISFIIHALTYFLLILLW